MSHPVLVGCSMDLPYENEKFDVSLMALVIFFVPDPKKGVTEWQGSQNQVVS